MGPDPRYLVITNNQLPHFINGGNDTNTFTQGERVRYTEISLTRRHNHHFIIVPPFPQKHTSYVMVDRAIIRLTVCTKHTNTHTPTYTYTETCIHVHTLTHTSNRFPLATARAHHHRPYNVLLCLTHRFITQNRLSLPAMELHKLLVNN